MNLYTHPITAKGPTYRLTPTGTKLVHPGETVEVLTRAAAPVAPSVPVSELAKLQAGVIAVITAKLRELDLEDLSGLLQLEKAAQKPRSGVIGAIEAEFLKRQVSTLSDLDAEALATLLKAEQDADQPRPSLIEAVETEQLKRQAGS